MKNDNVQIKYLKDYKAPNFKVDKIDLVFDLENEKTFVQATMQVKVSNWEKEFELNGEELTLIGVSINDKKLGLDDYEVVGEKLIIKNPPKTDFKLLIENHINPLKNTALDGLYMSAGIFCTQNEPEGFRRITYFVDRPDNLAVYTTKIIADKKQCPILLSNGNLMEKGDLPGGKHFAVWADPFLKPCYLYALVAGDLGMVADTFTTRSGREIKLEIYVDKGNESKCLHAMESLKKSMKWDEDRFGLEYDLDIYMVVAVDAFNMGAMENKGLNIFNSAYVLADQDTATDDNFYGIESVIGHEYFHNWTGNRITCRDWFQLTLKEGLTVFRDQEFSADLNTRSVCRINDVKGLRAHQFNEDQGPTAHPIKPKSYIEMNNFYTATIYEKGAEVIRMIYTLLGHDEFRKGMDKYFELFDGQAVTTEDFVHAMSVANDNYDFSQFKLWYDQAGTPNLDIKFEQNLEKGEVKLKVTQSCPNVGGETIVKKPFHLPFKLGFVNEQGKDVTLTLAGNGNNQNDLHRGLIHIKNESEEFVFTGITSKVVPSLNRGFSAPVKIKSNLGPEDFAFLMGHDSDEFNRYEAFTTYAKTLIQANIDSGVDVVDEKFLHAYELILADQKIDHNFKALCLTLPNLGDLIQDQKVHDYKNTKRAIDFVKKMIASKFENQFGEIYKSLSAVKEFRVDANAMGERKLKNLALSYLSYSAQGSQICSHQYYNATNMTDRLSALTCVVFGELAGKDEMLNDFYNKYKSQTLVMQKWLNVQASSESESTFDTVIKLLESDVYDKNVPNLVRSLVGVFATNKSQFAHESGRGIKFIAAQIKEIDKINPQVASRLCAAFRDLKKMPEHLKQLAQAELEQIVEIKTLSKNSYEIISKTLA